MSEELSALERVRSRLEDELAGDEHWRALKQSQQQEDEGELDAARRARDTRLEMALAENRLYQAWRHLGQAIAALRDPDAGAEQLREATSDGEARAETGPMARRLAVSRMESPLEAGGNGEKPATADSSHQSQRAESGPPGPPPRGFAGAEPDEASVTFVRREPLLPTSESAAEHDASRGSGLSARLRGVSAETDGPRAFSPAESGGEEAEVVIVTADSARAQREAAARAGTIRRLRKALSGE
jgi:hypothetical protein